MSNVQCTILSICVSSSIILKNWWKILLDRKGLCSPFCVLNGVINIHISLFSSNTSFLYHPNLKLIMLVILIIFNPFLFPIYLIINYSYILNLYLPSSPNYYYNPIYYFINITFHPYFILSYLFYSCLLCIQSYLFILFLLNSFRRKR